MKFSFLNLCIGHIFRWSDLQRHKVHFGIAEQHGPPSARFYNCLLQRSMATWSAGRVGLQNLCLGLYGVF